jgi:predicted lipoprotein with Yx(FWY)xxD motif
MKAFRRSRPLAIIGLLAVLLAACGGTTEQDSTTTTTNNDGMTQGIPITLNMIGDTTAFIRTGNAIINGKETSVLTTTKGFAVYYYKADTALTSSCTGQCAKEWPPLVVDQGVSVASSVLLPKQLSVQHTANGDQVLYNGHALYTYSQDKQVGMARGYGQDMEWYLADTTMNNMTSANQGSMNNGTPVAPTAPANQGSMNNGTPVAPMAPANQGGMDNGTPVAPTAPANQGGMDNGTTMPGIPITSDTTGNMTAFIRTGKAAINGNVMSVLTTNKGFAIYYYRGDTTLNATCTGQCAKDWPPVLAPQGMATVSCSVTLPRRLSVHQSANGAQVFYDGHALYTYAQDGQAGIAMGRGQDLKWYLVGFFL